MIETVGASAGRAGQVAISRSVSGSPYGATVPRGSILRRHGSRTVLDSTASCCWSSRAVVARSPSDHRQRAAPQTPQGGASATRRSAVHSHLKPAPLSGAPKRPAAPPQARRRVWPVSRTGPSLGRDRDTVVAAVPPRGIAAAARWAAKAVTIFIRRHGALTTHS